MVAFSRVKILIKKPGCIYVPFSSLLIQWSVDTVVPWYSSPLIQWSPDKVVPCYNGLMIQ